MTGYSAAVDQAARVPDGQPRWTKVPDHRAERP